MSSSPEFPLLPPLPTPNQNKKKTRDLPNLSDCHCCKRRINSTNPMNRLKTLTSEWRIVLLCNSCHRLVESSKYCSYCLSCVSSSGIDSFFECKRCHRRIHRSCVSRFSFGSGNGSDFSVCFDCWIPNSIEKDYIRVCGGRSKKRVKNCENLTSLGSSRVCKLEDKVKCLEDMVNEANVEAQKKIAVAVQAKEKALTKAVAARRAIELANGALGSVAVDKGSDQGGMVVEDDAQLAIQLHRTMNSSPRISRNSLCLLNTNCVNVPSVRKLNNVGGDPKSVNTDSDGLCVSKRIQDEKCNDFSSSLITYSRKGRVSRDGMVKEEVSLETSDKIETIQRGLAWPLHKDDGDTHILRKGRVKEEPGDSLFKMYSRKLSHVERRNGERYHCFKTYSRRPSAMSHCKSKLLYNGFNLDHGTLTSAIALNCCEESRGFANGS